MIIQIWIKNSFLCYGSWSGNWFQMKRLLCCWGVCGNTIVFAQHMKRQFVIGSRCFLTHQAVKNRYRPTQEAWLFELAFVCVKLLWSSWLCGVRKQLLLLTFCCTTVCFLFLFLSLFSFLFINLYLIRRSHCDPKSLLQDRPENKYTT